MLFGHAFPSTKLQRQETTWQWNCFLCVRSQHILKKAGTGNGALSGTSWRVSGCGCHCDLQSTAKAARKACPEIKHIAILRGTGLCAVHTAGFCGNPLCRSTPAHAKMFGTFQRSACHHDSKMFQCQAKLSNSSASFAQISYLQSWVNIARNEKRTYWKHCTKQSQLSLFGKARNGGSNSGSGSGSSMMPDNPKQSTPALTSKSRSGKVNSMAFCWLAEVRVDIKYALPVRQIQAPTSRDN